MARDIIFAFLYVGGGIYLLLMTVGLIHKTVGLAGPRRIAAGIMAVGFIALGGYHVFQYVRFSSPEGQEILRKMHQERGNVIISPFE